MDKNKGWIKLYRSIEDHWLWQYEKFNYQSAWVDLLMMVNHEPRKIHIADKIITLQPGQKWTSIRKLAERWKWKDEKVSKFLKLLESDGMIHKESNRLGTLLTVVNYGDFQGRADTSGDTLGDTSGGTDGDTTGDTTGVQTIMYKNKRMKKNEKKYIGGGFQ